MADLGTITSLPLRDTWPTEDGDFTPWLADHLDLLADALGLELQLESVESPVGGFIADIVARELGGNRTVVIENQLEPTDHTHLGQLLTYAAGIDAEVIVWISRDFRPEHRNALTWLNRLLGESLECFGVVIEVLQIDQSKPAASFFPVVYPSTWGGYPAFTKSSDELSAKRQSYQKFFQSMIDTLREEHKFSKAKIAQPQNWYSFATGTRGFLYSVSFTGKGTIRVEIYINTEVRERNLKCLALLEGEREKIESELGEKLKWDRLDGRRACRISVEMEGSIEDSEETKEKLGGWVVERLLRFKQVFGHRLGSVLAKAVAASNLSG